MLPGSFHGCPGDRDRPPRCAGPGGRGPRSGSRRGRAARRGRCSRKPTPPSTSMVDRDRALATATDRSSARPAAHAVFRVFSRIRPNLSPRDRRCSTPGSTKAALRSSGPLPAGQPGEEGSPAGDRQLHEGEQYRVDLEPAEHHEGDRNEPAERGHGQEVGSRRSPSPGPTLPKLVAEAENAVTRSGPVSSDQQAARQPNAASDRITMADDLVRDLLSSMHRLGPIRTGRIRSG